MLKLEKKIDAFDKKYLIRGIVILIFHQTKKTFLFQHTRKSVKLFL